MGCARQEAWRLDSRSTEDIGLAVEIDPDGKAATLDSESLTGYGVSKPLRIGAQVRAVLRSGRVLRMWTKKKRRRDCSTEELPNIVGSDA